MAEKKASKKKVAKKKKATKPKSRIEDYIGEPDGNGTYHNGGADAARAHRAHLTIKPPNLAIAEFHVRGTSPYVQHAWSQKVKTMMRENMARGSAASRKRKAKEPKDFQAEYEGSMHKTIDGGYGIPAGAFAKGMVAACRLCEFKMTDARQAITVLPDVESADPTDRGGLVRITKGEPSYFETMVRIQQTTDIRARPLWEPGWEATVRVRFDGDVFNVVDLANLLMRTGMQVGVGEGRPSSPSGGMGWGLFELLNYEETT